ncbi:hypothetical protein HAX54_001259 [Datura stramonium]|uniref:Uncharacterized protein n=1 Tax=Datura stramonium TaxID=4076 RepID=A0ABS8T246_DATST|nr:hypothetical protein [Datura stramonium]
MRRNGGVIAVAVSPRRKGYRRSDTASAGWKESSCYKETAATLEKSLQQDSYHGRKPTVTDQESNHCMCCGGVLTAIAGLLQRKCDRCSG